jgi:hypothetical protein
MGVEMTDVLELVQCRTCRRAARPRVAKPIATPAATATLHMERARLAGEGLDAHPSLCGTPGATTPDPGLVRCRRCRRAMDVAELVEAPAAPTDPSPDALPFEPGPPVPIVELGGATAIATHFARIIERSRAGDDQSDRPRWRTLEAAVAKTTAIKQGRSPMRSGFRIEQESRSEGAVRTEDGRDDVIEIDRAFARAFGNVASVAVTVGLHTLRLPIAGARHVLERVLRGERSASDIADELVEAGIYANRELVARLIQNGKASMRELLERKGLIERRAERETQDAKGEGQDMAAPHGFDLETWKEILPLLGGISETMATQLMERPNDPLPVTKWFSGKVIAKREEILAWIGRQTMTRTGT